MSKANYRSKCYFQLMEIFNISMTPYDSGSMRMRAKKVYTLLQNEIATVQIYTHEQEVFFRARVFGIIDCAHSLELIHRREQLMLKEFFDNFSFFKADEGELQED